MSAFDLGPDSVLFEAVRVIETTRKTIAVVIDDDGRLLGTVTDGDIRRALLAGHGLDDPVSMAMNTQPTTAVITMSEAHILDLLTTRNLEAIPIVDETGRVVRVVHVTDLAPDRVHGDGEGFFGAVIMAGGEGKRLRPLTEDIPKPMIEVNGMPLLEHQVRAIARTGIKRLYIAVNYLNHVIEEYFGDGARFDISIHYLRERQRLGTVGALSLMPEPPDKPLMVVNADVLTDSDYRHFLNFHEAHDATVTVAAMDYRVEIPYGVIQAEGPALRAVEEKPSQRFLCNAGIYALSPEAPGLIPKGAPYDMTDLIESCLDKGKNVVVFPLHEYWTDIGTPAELAQARERAKTCGTR